MEPTEVEEARNSKWIGATPENCDLCHNSLAKFSEFYDALSLKVIGSSFDQSSGESKLKYGWCIMCPRCFEEFGVRLGMGLGQRWSTQAGHLLEGSRAMTEDDIQLLERLEARLNYPNETFE